MDRMLAMLDEALDYTFGLSTGLEYNPGLHATTDELRALARVVGANDRLIMSHMRNEDDDQLEASIAELLEQGEDARVHISHLKSVYGSGAARAEEILGILADARRQGIDITAEIYPYSASYTGIGIVFPVWAKTTGQFEVAKAERRDELAEYLRNRVNQRNGPEATLLGTDPWTGRTLAEVAHEMELPFEGRPDRRHRPGRRVRRLFRDERRIAIETVAGRLRRRLLGRQPDGVSPTRSRHVREDH